MNIPQRYNKIASNYKKKIYIVNFLLLLKKEVTDQYVATFYDVKKIMLKVRSWTKFFNLIKTGVNL